MEATYYTHMGSDNMVVDMARGSFSKTHDQYTDEQNARLIRYLARGMSEADQRAILEEAAQSQDHTVLLDCFKRMKAHTHWAPLAHPQITLHLEVPVFVARQDFKHIVGFTRSEASRRYVDSDPTFFTPKAWRNRPNGTVKQGSGSAMVSHQAGYAQGLHEDITEGALHDYRLMLEWNMAPEQARMDLPQSMYTSYYTTGSLAAWARAYNQRVDSHAQQEIQDLYHQIGEIIEPLFPVSWAALTQ